MKWRRALAGSYGIRPGKWVWTIGLVLGSLEGLVAGDQAPRTVQIIPAPSKRCALLVAVEPASAAPEASSTDAYRTNDVHFLAEQLRLEGYQPESICLMTPRAEKPKFHPLAKNVQKQIEELFGRMNPQDGLLMYWTGRAYQSADGQIWLAGADWDPAMPAETGLSVGWLKKQLAACRAQWKLMIIDTPFQQQTGPVHPASSEAVFQALEGTAGLALLASSQAQQPSLLWPKVEQSNFGFWLVQAFAGHADRDENSELTLQELFHYVSANVRNTAQEIFQQEQGVLFSKPPTEPLSPGVATVLDSPLKNLLEQFANQIAQQAVQHRVSQIAVVEFRPLADEPTLQTLLDGGPGTLGRWCAEQLQQALQKRSQKGEVTFQVFPYEQFHTVLSRNKCTPQLLQTSGTRNLSVQGRTPEGVVFGNFVLLTGRRLTLRCWLQSLTEGRPLGRCQQTAILTNEELAMLGLDPLPPMPPQPPSPKPLPQPIRPGGDRISFRLRIYVDGMPRLPQNLGNKEYVFFHRGEVYKIVVENYLTQPVYLRLLVDGLNTLPEPVPTQDTGGGNVRYIYLPAQRVHLEHAKAWRLDARELNGPPKRYTIEGFYSRKGTSSSGKGLYEWKSFQVVDPPRSWAALREYTQQIGIITAAFYAVPSESRGKIQPGGTGPGPSGEGQLEEYEETPVGPLLQVIHLYYALQPEG